MASPRERQFCAICAWRETCARKFCVPDGGAHCPDYTRDITIRDEGDREQTGETGTVQEER